METQAFQFMASFYILLHCRFFHMIHPGLQIKRINRAVIKMSAHFSSHISGQSGKKEVVYDVPEL